VDAGLILGRHATDLSSPYEALRCIGGFEHAALVGSALAAAQLGLQWEAVGESAVIARLLALWLNPSVKPWLQTGSSWFSCACGGRSE
jgi:nicotinate-nucleotide--dimethylbenzimidazole phosphoribosyltransferase